MSQDTSGVLRCATHQNTETYLRCNKCDTPICPKCLVYTPVGVRCKACANMQPIPTYDVSAEYLSRAILAGAGAGLGIGLLWGLISFLPAGGFILLWVTLFIGYGIGEAISRAANRKRGTALIVIAVLSVLIAFGVSVAVPIVVASGGNPAVFGRAVAAVFSALMRSPIQFLFVAVACFVAASRVR